MLGEITGLFRKESVEKLRLELESSLGEENQSRANELSTSTDGRTADEKLTIYSNYFVTELVR
jgi:hypothetical protein